MAKTPKTTQQPPAPVELSAPAPPTYLLWSEAKTLLMEQAGLKELEARRALRSVPTSKTGGMFKKWHRVRLLTYAERLRTDVDAVV